MPRFLNSWPTFGLIMVVLANFRSVLSAPQKHAVDRGLINESYMPIITDALAEPEHLTLEWTLPHTAALLEAEQYLRNYDISYRERGAREWQTVTGISGMDYSVSAPGRYEVQEIKTRVSDGQTITEGWFVLSSTSSSHIRWDIERFGVTPRLQWDASASDIADALSQLEQLRPFLPIEVEEHSSAADGTHSWRVTFMGISSDPLPILEVVEHSFDPSLWPSDLGSPIQISRLQKMVSADADSDTYTPVCVSTDIPGPLLNLNQIRPTPCRHQFVGLIPGVTYEFRVRANVDPYGAMSYSLPYEANPVSPRFHYNPSARILPPKLMGWTTMGVVLEVSLPLVGFDSLPMNHVFSQSINSRVEIQYTVSSQKNDTNLLSWQSQQVTPTNLVATLDSQAPKKTYLARGKIHISPLKPGMRYSFRVRGVASIEGFHIPLENLLLSAWSSELLSVPTRPSPPTSPAVRILPSSVRSTEVALEWSYVYQATTFDVFSLSPVAFLVEYAKNPTTHVTTEDMWRNAVSIGGRDALLTLGNGPAVDASVTARGKGVAVYSIHCGGEDVLSPTAQMFDWAGLLQDEGLPPALIAKSFPVDDDANVNTQCTYRYIVHGLDPAAIYHFRVRVVGLLELQSDVDAAFYNKELSLLTMNSNGPDATVVRSIVFSSGNDFRRFARVRTNPLARGTLDNHSDPTIRVPNHAQISRSAKERLFYDLVPPECPASSTASADPSSFPSIARKGTGSLSGGMGDEFHVSEIGTGGGHVKNFGTGYGSPGMVAISLFLKSDDNSLQTPISTIVFRHDPITGTLILPPAHELPNTKTITRVLDTSKMGQVSLPLEFTVPNVTTVTVSRGFGAPIEQVAYATIRLWGAGGGCGYTPERGTPLSKYFPPHIPSEYEHIGPLPGSTGTDPATGVESCVPGAGGAFVATTVAVSSGDRLVVFLGEGGAPGLGETGGKGGFPGGGAGGNGKRGGGGGGGGSTVVYHLPRAQDIPYHSLNLLSLLETSIPVAVAAGGAGSGASDYCCSYGGPGGDLCSEAPSGFDPELTVELTDEQEAYADGFEPALGESGAPLYAEHPDSMFNENKAFVSREQYRQVIGLAGGGANFFTPGVPGRSGSLFAPLLNHPSSNDRFFDAHPISLSKADKAPVSASSRVDYNVPSSLPYSSSSTKGGFLQGGRGASGWQGGGGGGSGIFGGGGGGSGIDGAGGGGGMSYIHHPYSYRFQASEAVTQLSSFSLHDVDTTSALVSWNSMRWIRNNRPGLAGHLVNEELDVTSYQIEMVKLSAPLFVQYTQDGKVIDEAYLEEWNWSVVWQGTGLENPFGVLSLLPTEGEIPGLHKLVSVLTALDPNSYYFVRIRGLHPTRYNLLAPSNILAIKTPVTDIPSWSPVYFQPEEGKRWKHEWQSFVSAAEDDGANQFTNGEVMQYLERNLPPALRGASLTPLAGYLIMFGGFSDGVDCNAQGNSAACAKWSGLRSETWRYDPVVASWYQFPLLKAYSPPPRERHAATSVNNRLYVFGGKGLQSNSYETETLSDLWVFDMGLAIGTHLATTIHSGSTIAIANKLPDDTYPIYDASCNVFNDGQCGIKKGNSLIFGLQVLTETEKQNMESASIPFGLSDGNIFVSDEAVNDDSCVEDISVWMELVHPCLTTLEISLIGPGPGFESVKMDGFEARDVPNTFRPMKGIPVQNEENVFNQFSHRRARIFQGGSGEGSANLYHECLLAIEKQELHKGYWTNPAAAEAFVGWNKNAQCTTYQTYANWMDSVLEKTTAALHVFDTCPIHHHEESYSILSDPSLVVFSEQFRAEQSTCCEEKTVYPPPKISVNGLQISDAVSTAPSDIRDVKASGERVTLLRGHIKPLDSLRANFASHSASGLWGLEIVDKYGLPMEGRLLRWGLIMDTVQCKKTPTWALVEPSAPEPDDPSTSTTRPVGRYDAISAVADGGWYIMGGKGSNRVLNDIWRYDFATSSWSRIVPLSSTPLTKPSIMFPQKPQSFHSPLSLTSLSGRSVVLSPWGLVSIGGFSGRNDVAAVASSQKSNLVTFPVSPDELVVELWNFRTLSWRPIEIHASYSELIALYGGRPSNRAHGNAVLLGAPNSCTSRRGSGLELLLMGGTKTVDGTVLSDAWKIDALELFTIEQLSHQSIYNTSSPIKQSSFFRQSQLERYRAKGTGKSSGFGSATMQELDDYLHGNVDLLNFDTEWSSLCSAYNIPGGTKEATWRKWCVIATPDSSTNGEHQCSVEEVLFRAYCERRWQSLGNW